MASDGLRFQYIRRNRSFDEDVVCVNDDCQHYELKSWTFSFLSRGSITSEYQGTANREEWFLTHPAW